MLVHMHASYEARWGLFYWFIVLQSTYLYIHHCSHACLIWGIIRVVLLIRCITVNLSMYTPLPWWPSYSQPVFSSGPVTVNLSIYIHHCPGDPVTVNLSIYIYTPLPWWPSYSQPVYIYIHHCPGGPVTVNLSLVVAQLQSTCLYIYTTALVAQLQSTCL